MGLVCAPNTGDCTVYSQSSFLVHCIFSKVYMHVCMSTNHQSNDLPMTGMPKWNEEIYQHKYCEPQLMTWEHHRDSTKNHCDL